MYKNKAFLILIFDDSSEMAPAMKDCCEFISRARGVLAKSQPGSNRPYLVVYVAPARCLNLDPKQPASKEPLILDVEKLKVPEPRA